MKNTQQVLATLLEDDTVIIDFLKAHFLALAVDKVTLETELSPDEIASRLDVPAMMLEYLIGDIEGHMTLVGYFAFVVAHGFVPQLSLIPLEEAKKQLLESLEKSTSEDITGIT